MQGEVGASVPTSSTQFSGALSYGHPNLVSIPLIRTACYQNARLRRRRPRGRSFQIPTFPSSRAARSEARSRLTGDRGLLAPPSPWFRAGVSRSTKRDKASRDVTHLQPSRTASRRMRAPSEARTPDVIQRMSVDRCGREPFRPCGNKAQAFARDNVVSAVMSNMVILA